MNVLIVFCHPEPSSFNGALKNETVKALETNGHLVEVSDLYAEEFDPVEKAAHYSKRLDQSKFDTLAEQRNAYKCETLPFEVQREIERLQRCDFLIFQFPLWWHQQPAMIKGWCDRVFVGGGLYTSIMRYDKGYFSGKRAICLVTSGAPLDTFTKAGRGGGTIDDLLHPLNFSLYYMGFDVLPAYLITEVQGAGFAYKDSDQLSADLLHSQQKWVKHLLKIDAVESLSYPGWDDWDARGVAKP